jgi:hypothetical protein
MLDARRGAILSTVAAGLLALPGAAFCGVYKWVDENDVTHYTVDRAGIPSHLRSPLNPTGGLTAAAPKPAPFALPPDADAENLEGVAPQDMPAALELEEEIERDREALKDMISRQGMTGAGLANDPKLREIAERLPGLQNESEKLKKARD